jgi:hypothetical protein
VEEREPDRRSSLCLNHAASPLQPARSCWPPPKPARPLLPAAVVDGSCTSGAPTTVDASTSSPSVPARRSSPSAPARCPPELPSVPAPWRADRSFQGRPGCDGGGVVRRGPGAEVEGVAEADAACRRGEEADAACGRGGINLERRGRVAGQHRSDGGVGPGTAAADPRCGWNEDGGFGGGGGYRALVNRRRRALLRCVRDLQRTAFCDGEEASLWWGCTAEGRGCAAAWKAQV